VKNQPNEYSEKRKATKNANIRSYQRKEESSCCANASPIAETVSRKNGGFGFTGVTPGRYWVVVLVEGKEYSRAIEYVPDGQNKTELSCSRT
jgi:hypothetical protein